MQPFSRLSPYIPDKADVQAMLARIPPSWTQVETALDGAMYRRGSIQVMISLCREADDQLWVHVSACGRTGPARYFLPSWEELARVKHDFIGDDGWAYQVLPPAAEHININPHVLHLWSRFDGQPALPDFSKGMGTI